MSIYSWWGELKPANTIIQIQVTEVFINLDMKRFAASASLGTCPSAMESRVAMAAVPAVNKRWWNAVDETWSQQPIVVWDSWGWSVSAALPISQWSCPWGSHMRMFAGLKSVLWPFSAQVHDVHGKPMFQYYLVVTQLCHWSWRTTCNIWRHNIHGNLDGDWAIPRCWQNLAPQAATGLKTHQGHPMRSKAMQGRTSTASGVELSVYNIWKFQLLNFHKFMVLF